MADQNPNSLCRICLEKEANIPIFETKDSEDRNVFLKLCSCLGEKIEDIDGYPRNICRLCHITLNNAYNFIRKYKESSKLLEQGLQMVIKQEIVNVDSYSGNENSEYEIEIDNMKQEPEIILDDSHFVELLRPGKMNDLKDKLKRLNRKKSKKNENKPLSKNKTNKIAASILEGDFVWAGDECLQSKFTMPVVKREHPNHPSMEKRRRKIKLKKPKEPKIPDSLLCDHCGAVFDKVEKLKRHRNKVHLKSSSTCPTCSKVFVSNYYLNRHVLRVHKANTTKKDFICSTCGKQFMFNGEMREHIRRVHNKHLHPKKQFPCKLCDKTYACAKSVLVHERSAHTGERPAVCSVCNSSFFHEEYLKEHMRLHTGETPFKCPVCGRGYAQAGNMKSHIRHVHKLSQLDEMTLKTIKPNYLRLMKP